MSIQIVCTITSSLVTARTHGQLMRKLSRQAMTRIRFDYLPRHFETNQFTRAGGPYGYVARTARYQIRKAKVKGHQKPLRFSGQMLLSIMGSSQITATQNRGRLKVRNYYSMTTQRRSEVENLAQVEREEIAARMERDYARLAARPEYQRQRRRKSQP